MEPETVEYLKPITVEIEVDDVNRTYTIENKGYLIDEKSAIYIDDNSIWAIHVLPTCSSNVYRKNSEGILLMEIDDGLSEKATLKEIIRVFDNLSQMTAWEFVRDILIPLDQDISLDLN
jgi:hypothetical protein